MFDHIPIVQESAVVWIAAVIVAHFDCPVLLQRRIDSVSVGQYFRRGLQRTAAAADS